MKDRLNEIKFKLSDFIHSCLVEYFGIPQEKRFHGFFPLDKNNFIYPSSQTENYIILEITMFEGGQI
ncbi:MAG: hypothetical protein ACFFAS_01095 [Promethearchaeota archaeon]